jgi:surface antigen
MIESPGQRLLALIQTILFLGFAAVLVPRHGSASQHDAFEHLRAADRKLAAATIQGVLEHQPSGELVLWRNEVSSVTGSVMPLRTFKIKTGHFCREYRETLVAENKLSSRIMTACRSDEGTWIAVER